MDFAEGCLQTRNMDLQTCVWLPIDFGRSWGFASEPRDGNGNAARTSFHRFENVEQRVQGHLSLSSL